MSDYFDNNKKWEWKVDQEEGEAIVEVDHGDHTHKLDLTQIPAEELNENPNQYLGDAHRNSDHYPKEDEDENEQEKDEDYSI